ncbi:lanthionine synthetase LanC family protein [Spirosoma soli]|uniref:Lanthionine synthetase LanC family protein n=1 Tax=Spirosoma soli TaxID=1770529 RepID=A0ABW5M9L6_9BACT
MTIILPSSISDLRPVQRIASTYLKKLNGLIEQASVPHDGLLSGNLGVVWYYAHLWLATHEQTYFDQTQTRLEQVFDHMNTEPQLTGASLGSGGAGFGYVLAYLRQRNIIDLDLDEELQELDAYLHQTALEWIASDFIDYLHGATGVLHYFTERLGNPAIYSYAKEIVEQLLAKAIVDQRGLRLRSFLMDPQECAQTNFSLSHGQAGFLSVLLRAYQRGLRLDIIPPAIRQGADYFMNNRAPISAETNQHSFFPFTLDEASRTPTFGNRLAWCYGDLNAILFLYQAADLLKDAQLRKRVDLMGAYTLLRTNQETTLVKDAHFCHGAAGVAQMYRTLHRLTGLDIYQTGYRQWMDTTLSYIDEDLQKATFDDKAASLLEGWVGVALTLLSYVSEEELHWSRAFLL